MERILIGFHVFLHAHYVNVSINLSNILVLLIYFIIHYRYIDAVFPGRYGIAKPPYFFLLPSYWIGKRYNKKVPTHTVHVWRVCFIQLALRIWSLLFIVNLMNP